MPARLDKINITTPDLELYTDRLLLMSPVVYLLGDPLQDMIISGKESVEDAAKKTA